MSGDLLIFLFSIIFGLLVLKKILPARGVEQITVDELKKMIKDEEQSVQLIDVRPPAQFSRFHIYGFNNIPLKEIRSHANMLSKDKKVVLICQTGAQGNEACKRLKRRGFTDLANVRGGLSAWDPH